jgi:hypothetical protein
MCCCIQIFCLGCYGCVYSVAYILSPTFRRAERERRCEENEANEQMKRDLRDLSVSLDQLQAGIQKKNAKLVELMESDPELKRRVDKAVAAGVPLHSAIKTCHESMNSEKLDQLIADEMKDGMPREFATRIARMKLDANK